MLNLAQTLEAKVKLSDRELAEMNCILRIAVLDNFQIFAFGLADHLSHC